MIKVGVIIPARNEAHTLPYTLLSLHMQSLKPKIIIVVDDGSDDNTSLVAEKLGATVIRVKRSFKASATGTPYLAYVINQGFKAIESEELDFIMISGAECVYPKDYIKVLTYRMIKDRVVLASGVAVGEYTSSLGVRGAGRLIFVPWFKKIGFRYPLNYGYETWLVFKALSQGFRVKVYHDIKFYLLRKTQINESRAYLYGKAMRSLGYNPLFVVMRGIYLSLTRGRKNILANMVRGFYSLEKSKYYEGDIRAIVKRLQALRILKLRVT